MNGWKTYAVAAVVALIAVMEGMLGVDIPGAEMQQDWLNYVAAALGLSALRNAIK